MSKRKLSTQQQSRVRAQQQQRLAHAEQGGNKFTDSELGPPEAGIVIAHYGKQADVEDKQGKLHHCWIRQNLGNLVAGDEVAWRRSQTADGVIEAVQPRKSVLGRANKEGEIKPVAANIDRIIIIIACKPEINHLLLDSYLVAAEQLQITPIIVLNKADLLDAVSHQAIYDCMAQYKAIGYQCLECSAIAKKGTEELQAALQDLTSVLVGQSGVGKSSIISKCVPDQEIRVGELSQLSQEGRHTTTHSQLYHLPHGGVIIDSPGIREFGLWHIDDTQVAAGFIEFKPFLEQCKFRNCSHTHEPGCAVRDALQAGTISNVRYQNYLQLLQRNSHL